jgi:hypothetical protein
MLLRKIAGAEADAYLMQLSDNDEIPILKEAANPNYLHEI